MGKNSSQLGHLHAKVDNKENEMCAISQKMENLTKEFLYFAERIDGSENHLWGDVCATQVKLFSSKCCYQFFLPQGPLVLLTPPAFVSGP